MTATPDDDEISTNLVAQVDDLHGRATLTKMLLSNRAPSLHNAPALVSEDGSGIFLENL
jgi:hypothetical protein